MSKLQKVIMFTLTLATLAGIVIALFFLPDTIPLHFGTAGAGSFASKYYLLFFVPVPAILFWAICRKMN